MATVDGRNVPLTVGYHKVTVDIRDQIARTTIEESFVNHTDGRLEGVFYFPLPQDASISGFGMWIGDELVEADVVEKQRAREIYETILRERRDPGLLEWTGGNIFKARVFPIAAKSEKRIKITYTQVLPLRGGTLSLQYALQSEMLKQHPLRELAIDVKLNSAVPLRSVTSPTHATRDTPDRAFGPRRVHRPGVHADAGLRGGGRDGRGQADVVMIPHRRGDDGYFMRAVDAAGRKRPVAAGVAARRRAAGAADPGRHLGLAGRRQPGGAGRVRRRPAGLAGAQGQDQPGRLRRGVRLGLRAVPAGGGQGDRRRPAVPRRAGVAGLDRPGQGVASACGNAGPTPRSSTSATASRPPATATRWPSPSGCGGWPKGTPGRSTPWPGSSFEPVVLKAIASLGGGSVRQISGAAARGRGPRAAGRDDRPALRDLKVEFRGLRTARVYPEELPNLPLGTQQIILGRYLPEGRDQSGEVIVTGVRGASRCGSPAACRSKTPKQGNSFIPRLWARMHLDALLQQGASPAVRDEIIALSEEYHIITPYTSLLVLESDADRERFGVKTRFQMRDGEKFFAEGRDNANYELVQQQMKRAGTWRLGLRRDVLRQLATLGRDESIFQAGRGRIDLDAEPDYDSLIELIRSTVHPITWDEVGRRARTPTSRPT